MGAAIQAADAAVSAGYARTVVVFRAIAQGQFGRFGQAGGSGGGGGSYMGGPFAWNGTYGMLSPAHQCALHTVRFMHDHGISQEALCEISLACYANAQRNPRALRYGKPLTREAYHASERRRHKARYRTLAPPFPETAPSRPPAVGATWRGSDHALKLKTFFTGEG